jgi:hypothetical protein
LLDFQHVFSDLDATAGIFLLLSIGLSSGISFLAIEWMMKCCAWLTNTATRRKLLEWRKLLELLLHLLWIDQPLVIASHHDGLRKQGQEENENLGANYSLQQQRGQSKLSDGD